MARSPSPFIPLFIPAAISILFPSHYFLYFSLVHFFAITGRRKLALALILFLLPTIFILTPILARRMENPV